MKDKEFIKTTACIGAGLVAFMIAGTVIYQVSRQKLILPVSFKDVETGSGINGGASEKNNINGVPETLSAEDQKMEDMKQEIYENVHNNGKTYKLSTDETSETNEDGVRLSADGVYMEDTVYDGTAQLPLAVFQTPFQKSIWYKSNKEFMDDINDEIADTIINYASSSVTDIWGKGASYIKENKETYINTVTDYLLDQMYMGQDGIDGELYTNKEVAEHLADWFVDNNVEANVTFVTDKSLIYTDYFIYVRGTLNIEPQSCEADIMENFIPAGMDYKNGGKYICEVAIGYYADIYKDMGIKDYQVLGYQIIGKVS